MKLEEKIILNKNIKLVWQSLNDIEVLKKCISGCEELKGNISEELVAIVKQKIGPVSATFKGKIKIKNIIKEKSYTIEGEGKGGSAGFAKGIATVNLVSTESEKTIISYTVEAKISGKIAQLGSRLIGVFAKKMAKEFFDKFKTEIEKSNKTLS